MRSKKYSNLRNHTKKRKKIVKTLSSFLQQKSKRKNSLLICPQNMKKPKLEEKRININDLPLEITQHIFSFLPGCDRLSCSLVCSWWLQAIDTPSLLDDIWLKVRPASLNTIGGWKHKDGAMLSRHFVNFKICQIHISFLTCWFFVDYGNHIKRLIFNKCRANTREHIVYCPNLIYLQFVKYFVPIAHSLPKLKYLCLDKCATDMTLLQLSKNISHLEVLELNFYKHQIRKFVSVFEKSDVFSSPLFLTILGLYNFVPIKNQTLRTLKVSTPDLMFSAELRESSLQITGLNVNGVIWPECTIRDQHLVADIIEISTNGLWDLGHIFPPKSEGFAQFVCFILICFKSLNKCTDAF